MAEKDRLDQFLDKTLAEYSDASPRAGLEQRILAHVAAQSREQRWSWRWIWIAGPILSLAAVLIVMFALRQTPKRDSNVANETPAVAPTNPPLVSLPPVESNHVVVAKPPRATRKAITNMVAKTQQGPDPKLATFPAPDGSEVQARLLLLFVVKHPEQAKEVVREQQEFHEMAETRMNQDSENRSERQR